MTLLLSRGVARDRTALRCAMSAIALSTALLGACGSDANPVSDPQNEMETPAAVAKRDDALHLIASVDLPQGTLKFYEPEPGTLVEVEQGVLDLVVPDHEPANLNAVQRYEFLSGKPAPQVLVDAQQRSQPSLVVADAQPEPVAQAATPVAPAAQDKSSG